MAILMKDQQDEIDAHYIYALVADFIKDKHNSDIIRLISKDELKHYHRLKSLTGISLKPRKRKIKFFTFIIRVFGITFGIKLLEKGESNAVSDYSSIDKNISFMDEMIADEQRHEKELIDMLDEDRLNYMGSVVLGLNDALVELTGALAGFTFAFQDTRLIALTGLITGISASFSMAASEYLSTRHDGGDNALKSSIYTGVAYIFTVMFLIMPFLILSNPFISLGVTIGVAVLIIFLFNYYVSVAKDYNFRKRFMEMALISIGVAGISFLIGMLVKQFIGVDL
ncbi:MAG: VIT1/CCC1 transporter family protein [Clostridiales bacterium]|nr:VIT1/CCC1 transporter family protein [Clostridiales bacterium]